jgi:hypothetical protein
MIVFQERLPFLGNPAYSSKKIGGMSIGEDSSAW